MSSPITVSPSNDDGTSLGRLFSALEASYFSYLLVLDGVDDLSLAPCLPRLLKCTESGQRNGIRPNVLLTSRSPLLGEDIPECPHLFTNLLTAQESTFAMLQLTWETNLAPRMTDAESHHLAQLCSDQLSGVTPLVLDQLVYASQSYPGCSFTRLKKRLDDSVVNLSDNKLLEHVNTALLDSSRSAVPVLYAGMNVKKLIAAGRDDDNASDSGFAAAAASDASCEPLSFLLSEPAIVDVDDDEDVDTVDAGDFLRCIIFSTCPVTLPVVFLAKQVSQLVYGDPDKISSLLQSVASDLPAAVGRSLLENSELQLHTTQSEAGGDSSSVGEDDMDDSDAANGGQVGSERVSITYDSLHGWLSFLKVVEKSREEPEDRQAITLQSSLDWEKDVLSYSYAVRHGIESCSLQESECERRHLVASKAITSFLSRYAVKKDCQSESVILVIDAGHLLCRKVLSQRFFCSEELCTALRAVLEASREVLALEDDHEGRLTECVQLSNQLSGRALCSWSFADDWLFGGHT